MRLGFYSDKMRQIFKDHPSLDRDIYKALRITGNEAGALAELKNMYKYRESSMEKFDSNPDQYILEKLNQSKVLTETEKDLHKVLGLGISLKDVVQYQHQHMAAFDEERMNINHTMNHLSDAEISHLDLSDEAMNELMLAKLASGSSMDEILKTIESHVDVTQGSPLSITNEAFKSCN